MFMYDGSVFYPGPPFQKLERLDPSIKKQMRAIILFEKTKTNQKQQKTYHETSHIKHTFVGNIIVDHSDVVGASPVGAAPSTSSFST